MQLESCLLNIKKNDFTYVCNIILFEFSRI
jgi:hypothetical protein